MQAQVLSAVVYRVVKKIQKPTEYGENRFTVDLTYLGDDSVAVSVENCSNDSNVYYLQRKGLKGIGWFSMQGSCITISNDKKLISCKNGILEKYQSYDFDPFVRYRNMGYISTGLAHNKSRFYWVCLWNQSLGKNSHGIVVKLHPNGHISFEIKSNKNMSLFTCPTYVAENSNEDVCVSDVGAVVVTDKAGMLRFRYTGRPGDPPFDPYGICCDSGRNIIVADMKNDNIHVIDQDGGFLHYIQYDGMKMPRALCIDENEKLYVGEWNCDVIKLISRD
jgi:hypothetical protein